MKKKSALIKRILRKTAGFIIFAVAFIVLVFCELIGFSKASFSDFFTQDKVSAVKDCPLHIRRNIIVDASEITSDKGGIKALTENIIDGISKKRPDWRLIVLSNKEIKHPFEFKNDNVKVLYVDYFPITKPLLWIREALNFFSLGYFHDQITQLLSYDNIYFNKNSCDLFFDPYAEIAVNDYYSVPKISLIHDMMYADIPEFLDVDAISKRKALDELKENSVRIVNSSKKIITVSNFSKKRIIKNFGVKKNFVKAIHIKLANRIKGKRDAEFTKVETSVLEKFNLKKKKYLIYPSMVRTRKNHKRLFVAFAKFMRRHMTADIKLVIVGMINPKVIQKLNSLIDENSVTKHQSNRIKKNIVFTQFIPNEELDVLLSDSLAMIFPSLYEGFGMPIIEAMNAGVPVACSNVTSLPEVAGNAALFFDPRNTDDIANVIDDLVENSALRSELIRRGYERAKKFSDMDSMIDEYIKVFEKNMKPLVDTSQR